MEEQDEAELLERAAKGDTRAFLKLCEARHAALFRFAYRLTSAIEIAEDLTQESFLRLMGHTRFDQERGSLRQYLYGIMRNLVRQRQQSSGREIRWTDEAEEELNFTVAAPADAAADLTAVPYPGYAFQKVGVVSGFGLSFSWNGDHFALHTRAQITEPNGNWNLYVLAAPSGSAGAASQGFSYGELNSVKEFVSRVY